MAAVTVAPLALVIAVLAFPEVSGSSSSTLVTRGADNYRTSWYPDQSSLTPQLLAGGTFGQQFKTAVNGSVYGQPVVADGQLLVNTENNEAYGLNPVTGAIEWSRQFGTAVLASDLGCGDLSPNMGITSTPVVDTTTNTEYLVDNEYVSGNTGASIYYMHALNLAAGGAEEPGFPVAIQGTAANDPSLTFFPRHQLQRPGLLLLGGTVYTAFGAHCDIPSWQGWVAGVSESGKLTTLWTTDSSGTGSGAGIWMAGGGLVSDGPNQILFATGNGASNSGPIPDSSPPANVGESVVRLTVQPDGSLKPTDFFTPYDAATLDAGDIDFGSGSPVALPESTFGTAAIPHLAVEVGKEGYVFLLNRDRLGGEDQGANGTDNVVGKFGPYGGVWSSPAVWPGDGGWIYIPTANGSTIPGGSAGQFDAYKYGLDGSGNPALNLVGHSSDQFGYGSSSAVVTSNGTTSGSALVWVVWSPSANGIGAQLRAYDPVPVNGLLQQVWSTPIGTASKFNPPGVSGGRIYVGTRDGNVIGFGAPVSAPVTASPPTFPPTVVGQTSTQTLSITANSPVTVSSLTASGPFSLGTPSTPLPAALAAGSALTVPVTFSPTTSGLAGGGVTIATGSGQAQVTLTASAEVNGPDLEATTTGLSFGGVPPGSQQSNTVGFLNDGSAPVTISAVDLPSAPFSTTGAPSVGQVIAPGAEVLVNCTFAPTVVGQATATLEIDSNGGDRQVALTGNATPPPQMAITPTSITYGNVRLGQSVTQSFQVANSGGSPLTITKSKPPGLGPFTATTTLAEGTTIAPGASVTESVTFKPKDLGSTTDSWTLNGNDSLGVRQVTFTGYGLIGDPSLKGWKLNGSALVVSTGATHLTTASALNQKGSAFWPTPVSSSHVVVTFTSYIGSGTGANGTAFVLGNATDPPTSLGSSGVGLGFYGIPGVAVALDTHKSLGNPSTNFVGVTNGPVPNQTPQELNWLSTNSNVPALRATHAVQIVLNAGVVTISIDGTQVLSQAVTVGPQVLVGFTGSTGAQTDIHSVSNVSITAG
jgi:hypothetical protein